MFQRMLGFIIVGIPFGAGYLVFDFGPKSDSLPVFFLCAVAALILMLIDSKIVAKLIYRES